MKRIVEKEEKVLRKVAKPIIPEEIRGKKIQKTIAAMKETLANETDGVALAAPQIGESVRLFIVSPQLKEKERAAKKESRASTDQKGGAFEIYINPEIVKISRKKRIVDEGCLSVRGVYGRVKRAEKVSVKAYDENGRLFVKGASELLAQAFQHEIDHLDGILFTDKASHLETIPENSHGEMKKKEI